MEPSIASDWVKLLEQLLALIERVLEHPRLPLMIVMSAWAITTWERMRTEKRHYGDLTEILQAARRERSRSRLGSARRTKRATEDPDNEP